MGLRGQHAASSGSPAVHSASRLTRDCRHTHRLASTQHPQHPPHQCLDHARDTLNSLKCFDNAKNLEEGAALRASHFLGWVRHTLGSLKTARQVDGRWVSAAGTRVGARVSTARGRGYHWAHTSLLNGFIRRNTVRSVVTPAIAARAPPPALRCRRSHPPPAAAPVPALSVGVRRVLLKPRPHCHTLRAFIVILGGLRSDVRTA